MQRAQRLLHHSNALPLRSYPQRRQQHATTTRRHAPRRGLHLLQHQHMKPASPTEPPFVRYDDAEALQEEHRARLLAWKAASHTQGQEEAVPPPRPQLLSFQARPTYTLGRRQDALTPAQASRLTRPLAVSAPNDGTSVAYTPQVKKTNRGGLTTYHGPGQLVFWPILDMHSPLHARFGVASYARLLERTTQALLAELFGIETYTNPDEPGVWVGAAAGKEEERKIAALGVHHRRYVTALGVALNVHLPVAGEDEGVNPWARFVPCGLQGKLVTSVAKETGRAQKGGEWDMNGLADMWAARFEEGLLKG
ncbi:Octanoyltransferase [Akanthomyces lecanii RCEF 1005]|uniref:lipoyl(octanoyl) transferase n=1 Tax=Akanthomyces lecanii RCEF 1005 TaxID=1081108 RepID=A0A168FK47_CORDF|nr:Octanoyltransferase [Akanthomyces lecanii RCEF 1005]